MKKSAPKTADPKCIPCDKVSKKDLFTLKKSKEYVSRLKGWKIMKKGKEIQKEFTFKDFIKAMSFVGQIADVAEMAGHHPDLFISYNHVTVSLSTHSIGGLTENDFIVAAQIDGLRVL
jgi:4a-hydroxytetrahydrobiopterin dehydratase